MVYRQAQALNDAAPDARFYWIYGNHDDNLFGTQPGRIPRELRDAVQWDRRKDLAEELALWKVIRKYSHREYLRLGPVTLQHGCDTTAKAGENGAVVYGTEYGLYIHGHTHQPMPVSRAMKTTTVPLKYWYCNPGCGAGWDAMHYMDRKSMARWGRGCIVAEVPDSSIEQRRTAYASKNWDAELRVHSMAHE